MASRSEPRERLLATAAEVFYADGVHAVGVDRLVAAAGVTKATFYRHFPTKEELVVAYLELRDQRIREQFAGATAEFAKPQEMLAELVAGLGAEMCGAGFRGCPFINAAAEYPDAESPVRQVVTRHRTWFRATLTELLAAAGHPDPDAGAATLVLLRDGAMVGGYLDGDQAAAALAAAVATVAA